MPKLTGPKWKKNSKPTGPPQKEIPTILVTETAIVEVLRECPLCDGPASIKLYGNLLGCARCDLWMPNIPRLWNIRAHEGKTP